MGKSNVGYDEKKEELFNEKRNETTSPRVGGQVVTGNNGELFEGDIIMDSRFRASLLLGSKSKKSALLDSGWFGDSVSKWPNGIVFYEIEYSFTHKALLQEAMREFERRTCIRFERNTLWTRENYIVFSSDEEVCSSSVGMVEGGQVIYLGEGCKKLGTVSFI